MWRNPADPVKTRHCLPCLVSWRGTETDCDLCGKPAADGNLPRDNFRDETYNGVYEGIVA
jgi:hypothetical protein